MSDPLLIYEDSGKPLTADEVTRVFEDIAPGTVRTGGLAASECLFESSAGSVFVRFPFESGTIRIEGAGLVAAEAAVKIRRALDRDLHLIDQSYSFDILLDGTQESADLLETIENSD